MNKNPTLDRYLHAVMKLRDRYCCVRSVDVAHYLGCSKPSVSASVKQLIGGGLLEAEEDGNLRVTPAGEEYARRMLGRAGLFQALLEAAGVERQRAGCEAFAMSQAVSDETFAALKAYFEKTPIAGDAE